MNICIYYTEGLLWAKLKNKNENINLEWTMLNLITGSENFQSDLILFLHNLAPLHLQLLLFLFIIFNLQ